MSFSHEKKVDVSVPCFLTLCLAAKTSIARTSTAAIIFPINLILRVYLIFIVNIYAHLSLNLTKLSGSCLVRIGLVSHSALTNHTNLQYNSIIL